LAPSPPPVVDVVRRWLTTEVDVETTRYSYQDDDHNDRGDPQSKDDDREK
jgi:hypothetical protein